MTDTDTATVATETHPPITDGEGTVWTWRPASAGYVVHRLTDFDAAGAPRRGVRAETIRELWPVKGKRATSAS